MNNMIAFFVRRGLLVNMLSGMLLLGGIYAAMNIQREAFPSVNFDLVVIGAAYPGASPQELEQLVTMPIERELKGIDGIKKTTSTSYPGTMEILIQVDPNYTDRSRFVSDVQQAVNRAVLPDDLPADPFVKEIKSEQTPVISLSIFGDIPALKLKHIANQIEDDLLALPGVSKVNVFGDRKEEIRITLKPEKMKQYRVSTDDVIGLIKRWNVNAPGGQLNTQEGIKTIRVNGEFTSAKDAASLVIRANEFGQALYLSDIADVTQTLEKPRRYVDAMGEPAINFTVVKKGDADIIDVVDHVRAYLPLIPKHYGDAIQVRAYKDFSINTRVRLNVLTSNGAIGLVLVLITLFMFLRPAVAVTTAWGLPIIFFSGLLVLFLMGTTLNLLTMFGFIIVLGLMVDDAIIIGENATYHMEKGLSPTDAAIKGTQELLGPVTATVLTTVVAFLPMMFMDGIIGKFVYSIPVVVVILLMFSWLEAIFILPNHVADFANPNKHPKERKVLVWLTNMYEFLLRKALRLRYVTVALTVAAFIGSIALAGVVKFQLFPPGAEDQFYLQVTLPAGSSLSETRQTLQALDKEVRKHVPEALLETTVGVAGDNAANEQESLKQIGDRFGYLKVILISFAHRDISAYAVMDDVKAGLVGKFPDVDINYVMLKGGPPTGRALQVEITGTDTDRMQSGQALMALLQSIDGVHSVESGLREGSPEIHVEVDRKLAAYANIDLASIATSVRAAFDGIPVSTLKQGVEEVDVTIRFPELAQQNVHTLEQLLIPNRLGGLVPLGKVATFKEVSGLTSLRHKDGLRVLNVTAEVDEGVITSKALNDLVKSKDSEWLSSQDPAKVKYVMGGEQEKTDESVQGLVFSFIFALIGIFVILAIQFNRIAYPFLVMFAIPFGVIGIVVGLFLHGQPLSFMSLMGFVALTGVVVNSSLVLAVLIQREFEDGKPWFEAIVYGGKRRFRAVMLTAITTVVGLLPTAYGWGGFDPFVAPMALALSWGLIFSTLITLFAIPATLAIALDVKSLFQTRRSAR
ncbi:efflux RND transporter permease subunit [Ghiorsea bivora]|uniref:efflux RND transporter permease subunit n=1 Tax=Ghiorsea bivora TaxID=1485545 RepID=UPI00056DA6B5|nr:efflux RND transporter permease subunit [Ghiorsea bivora]